jgi:regulatory protein CII
MNARSPLARHQIRRLEQLRAIGVCTDESLAAYLREVGEPCERTTLVRYRAGERSAPLGLLDLVLSHSGDAGSVLDLWAREHGCRVVPDADPDTDERGLSDRAFEIVALTGTVASSVRDALADGRVDDGELDTIRLAAAQLRRAAAELESLARRGAA